MEHLYGSTPKDTAVFVLHVQSKPDLSVHQKNVPTTSQKLTAKQL